MIDINYKYAQWSTNVNVSGMNWQTYHEGIWYNANEKTYDQAVDEIKETIRQKVLKDHPHLTAFDNTEDLKLNRFNHINTNDGSKEEWKAPTEKINKGTIEEQIESFEGTPEELMHTWHYVASMNPKYKKVFDKKFKSINGKLKTT